MNGLSLLIVSLLAVSSCDAVDREQAIFDLINKGEPEKALSVLSLSECELYLDSCATLGAGLAGYEGFEDEGIEYLLRAAAAGHPRANVIIGNFMIANSDTYTRRMTQASFIGICIKTAPSQKSTLRWARPSWMTRRKL